MCGILGFIGKSDVSPEVVNGLTALQHRGQDAAGIVTFDSSRFKLKKGLGLVREVFHDVDITQYEGHCGLGHVRYATQGAINVAEAQPFALNYPFGIAMVHNGNVTNFNEIKERLYSHQHRLLETSSDLELILYTLTNELEKEDLSKPKPEAVFRAVAATQKAIEGAYCTVTILANLGMLAFADPWGIRPLVMGRRFTKQGIIYGFASESTCFDYLGYETVRDLKAGEAIFIDTAGHVHSSVCERKEQGFCVFEYIYFAREDSIMNGRLIAGDRVQMGRMLAKTFRESGLQPDIVIDVPSSAYFFASGLAEELGVPYRRGLAKNNHVGRSFISSNQKERENIVRQKLNPIRDVIKGKKIAVVDDSIVRGTTSKHLVRLLRETGAKEVYVVSAAPPIKFPCTYGIDMSIKREIIAANYDVEDIGRYIGADAVIYQKLDDLKEMYSQCGCCYACFDGCYPTGITADAIEAIERERVCSKKL
jgi:amidophosphoribosyltransferase